MTGCLHKRGLSSARRQKRMRSLPTHSEMVEHKTGIYLPGLLEGRKQGITKPDHKYLLALPDTDFNTITGKPIKLIIIDICMFYSLIIYNTDVSASQYLLHWWNEFWINFIFAMRYLVNILWLPNIIS